MTNIWWSHGQPVQKLSRKKKEKHLINEKTKQEMNESK
jgi:hypothetical protein